MYLQTAVTNDLRDFAKTSIEENKKFNHQTSADIKVLLNVVKGNFMDLNMINEKIKTEVKKINSELDNDKALQEYMKST